MRITAEGTRARARGGAARQNMLDLASRQRVVEVQIAGRGIRDQSVIDAMLQSGRSGEDVMEEGIGPLRRLRPLP